MSRKKHKGPRVGASRSRGEVRVHTERLDPEVVVETDTDLGPLWVERGATILTHWLLKVGYWDPGLSALMRNVLEPGMTFVDAGANIGYFSVLGSRLVGPKGRVIAIEPDPTNVSILKANLWRHGCSNVTVLPVAAWFERTHLHLARPADEGATVQVGRAEGNGELVPAAPLDDLITGRVDFMKVDCEHTDHVVIGGARRLIRENPSMLITVEFHPWQVGHTGKQPSEILDQYRTMELIPYEISLSGDGVTETTYERIAKPDLPEDHPALDFALSKKLPRRLLSSRKSLLERAGDLLEHVPEPVRPRIRHRDRIAPKRNS